MNARSLYLFDDATARGWTPFALTRPVGELLHGCFLQRGRWERVAGAACGGHLCDPALVGFEEPGGPPVVTPADVPAQGERVVVSSRAVVEGRLPAGLTAPATLVIGEEVVGWILPDGEPCPDDEALLDPSGRRDAGGERLGLEGRVLESPWDLMGANAERIAMDVRAFPGRSDTFLLRDVHVLGEGRVELGDHVTVEPGVTLDARDGPVILADRVVVQGPARLTGPLYVGPDSVILGGSVGTSSIGRVCKVRGEIEATVVNAFCNKAHDGYMGHAVLGRWVNLGALTTNSDLKNNYSAVRLRLPGGDVDTGLLKVGCFLGDHVKTGIGTLLNTGTVVGSGANLFGGRMPPTYVPPFSWGEGDELVEYRLDKFLEVAEAAMARREVELSEGMRQVLTRAWERSADERS
ncbi:MAG: hypothetical protein KY453_11400 [Gemmatimonadetes bacterium]|nr:hypothetical protein [Gemmatimonadota bacterium]